MPNVFHSSGDIAEVGAEWYRKLKKCAVEATQKRARLCLHNSPDDALHEMIIVFHRDGVIFPHRHRVKTESFHVIFGELDIVLFNEDGSPIRVVRMGPLASGKTHIYRLSAPIWHAVILRTEYAAIHEVTNGPFRPEEEDIAPWAPRRPDELKLFLDQSADLAGRFQEPLRQPALD